MPQKATRPPDPVAVAAMLERNLDSFSGLAAKTIRTQIAEIERLRTKLKSTERALDAYALQLANEDLLDDHPIG